jgi:hypothetical protein
MLVDYRTDLEMCLVTVSENPLSEIIPDRNQACRNESELQGDNFRLPSSRPQSLCCGHNEPILGGNVRLESGIESIGSEHPWPADTESNNVFLPDSSGRLPLLCCLLPRQ